MTVLDANVIGLVLPSITRDLQSGFGEAEWVVGGYGLAFAALLLPAGSIADRFGRRRMLSIGIVAFALASLACGLAPNVLALTFSRVVQGVGAAFLLAPALATLGHAYRDEAERSRAWATWGGIMGLAMVVSPLVGGLIAALAGWRFAFLLNLPLCAMLFVATRRWVGESCDADRSRLDLPGFVLFAAGMLGVTWALIASAHADISAAVVAASGAAGLALLGAFVAIERRSARPMLDLSLFGSLPFTGAVCAMFAYAATAQVMASLLPLLLQNGRGLSVLSAGLAMMPFAVAMLILPHVGRRLSVRLGSRAMLALGLGVTVAGNLALALAAGGRSAVGLALAMAVLGSGGGLLNGETQKAIMAAIPAARAGMGSGLSTTARFSGILIGFTSLGAVLAATLRRIADRTGITANVAAQIASGDAQHAASEPLRLLAQGVYSQAFAAVFLAAAGVAAVSALFVWWSMGRKTARVLAPSR